MVKKQTHPTSIDSWIQEVALARPESDIALLRHAIELSPNKDPELIKKGMMIADILLKMQLDTKTLAAALMYPAFKIHEIRHDSVADHFGEDIKMLLTDTMQMQSLEKLQQASQRGQHQIENLRKFSI